MPTVGVAIPVPEPFGDLLRQARASFGDSLAATVPSHITLLPPTEVLEGDVVAIIDRLELAGTQVEPFSVRLCDTDTFRPVSPVVFVTVESGAADIERLAGHVRKAVGDPDEAFPFHPHVTVAHHVDDAALDRAESELAAFDCAFRVEEFALYLLDDATGWAPHHTFALG